MRNDFSPPEDIADLKRLSAGVGSDPLLIQAAGGNTSVKDDGVMWIKASGTLLAEAETRDIFVPVDLSAMRAALDDPEVDADKASQFTLGDYTLRPSIETSLHAVFRHRVVVHVHCVNTLACAVRQDALKELKSKMTGFDWCFVPYTKPGANLAAQVRMRLGPETDVVVLANHGLIVAAETVAEAGTLLGRVVDALRMPPEPSQPVDMNALTALAEAGWQVPPEEALIHQVALDPTRTAQATGGSLYPDHVIFCGVGAQAVDALPDLETAPVFLLVRGAGAVMRIDASAGSRALMRCLGDVLARVPNDAVLTYLTPEQNAELLDWDAEKYRRKLNA